MADLKISQLPVFTSAVPAVDAFAVVSGGTTKQITTNQVLGSGGTATLASATITGALTVDTTTLVVDSTNDRVGMGTASPGSRLDVRFSTNPAINNAVPTNALRVFTSVAQAVDVGGQIGLGGLYNATDFQAFANISGKKENSTSGNNAGYLVIGTCDSGGTMAERYRIDSSGVATWSVAGTTAMTLNSTGLGIGVAPLSGAKLTVQGADNSVIAQFGGTNRQVRLSTSAISAVDNVSFNFIHTSGSGRFTFQNNSGTQTMLTIDDNGNNILRMPVTPPTLGVNLEGTFNLTSNTNLRISVRGSDGTTRVANITLA
jgi:citrate lyase gamma subunit